MSDTPNTAHVAVDLSYDPGINVRPGNASSAAPVESPSDSGNEATAAGNNGEFEKPQFRTEGPYLFAPKKTGNHWETCLDTVERHDNDMCKTWREEIDTLLVFAGLFTAIVTAFTIESYRWLRPDPADTTNQLLLTLSLQLANSSLPPAQDPALLAFSPSASAVRINCFWFLSITISLTAGVIGILCKQWMREFQRDAALQAKEALALRQLRYMGWKQWGVPQLVSLPAILLQGALLLFFCGLLDLLWSEVTNATVAACCSAIVGSAGMLMVLTTVIPAYYYFRLHLRGPWLLARRHSYPCPWKSPQSLLLLRIFLLLWQTIAKSRGVVPKRLSWLSFEREILDSRITMCGTSHAARSLERYASLALKWIQTTLAFNSRVRFSLFDCLEEFRQTYNCRSGREHFYLCVDPAECDAAEPTDKIVNDLFSRSHPELALEFYLRAFSGIPDDQHEAKLTAFNNVTTSAYHLARGTSLSIPTPLCIPFLNSIEWAISRQSGTSYTTLYSTLAICHASSDYDTQLPRIFQAWLSLIMEPSQGAWSVLSEQIDNILLVSRMGRLDFSALESRPAVFWPFMELLKMSSHFSADNEEYFAPLKEEILRTTSIPRDYFERDSSSPPECLIHGC